MTTAGQDISKAIEYAADQAVSTAGEAVQAVREAAGAVTMLALAVNNLAQSIGKQDEGTDDDGEPVRQPARAYWPRMNPAVRTSEGSR